MTTKKKLSTLIEELVDCKVSLVVMKYFGKMDADKVAEIHKKINSIKRSIDAK